MSSWRERYGIAEWYGETITSLATRRRAQFAASAAGEGEPPTCRFQAPETPCTKPGGVCSLQKYREDGVGRMGERIGTPVITCPRRFEEARLLIDWLAEIVGLHSDNILVAREVPFMRGTTTGKPAGMIDLVVANNASGGFRWFGLEIQAVYFSGKGMATEFAKMSEDQRLPPPFPNAIRRPDWRSSGAKRLMPQLEIKVPTVRRWGAKLAVAVDQPFFESVGGASSEPSHDLDDGDIIWLVPKLKYVPDGTYRLARSHWEVLTLEASRERLLAAKTISRSEFEDMLRSKLVSPSSEMPEW